jgi:hypothetical protein
MRELDGGPGLAEADRFALGRSMVVAHSMNFSDRVNAIKRVFKAVPDLPFPCANS